MEGKNIREEKRVRGRESYWRVAGGPKEGLRPLNQNRGRPPLFFYGLNLLPTSLFFFFYKFCVI